MNETLLSEVSPRTDTIALIKLAARMMQRSGNAALQASKSEAKRS